MTITEMRKLAAYHAQVALNDRAIAAGMGKCPVADKALQSAEQHERWSASLVELADAFERFGHSLAK